MNFHYGYLILLAIVLIAGIALAFSLKGHSKPAQPDIVYEVFVQSFCDSDHDGIGDLKGLISKLDYIRELGANAIWMMPVHPSPSYHKYDVSDYYGIHPDYGTMEDMDKLITEAHRRDMKIILDFVVNHTSKLHPWFIASSNGTDPTYHDYYVWKDFETVKDEIEKKTTTFDSDNVTQWHTASNQDNRYYGFFSSHMPDLNFDNPKVREEIYAVGKFWLEKGIDGFRLDAARHIYPDDQLDNTRKFWEEFTFRMKKINPDVKIVGEVWMDPKTLATLFKGLPSLFNFELTNSIPASINERDPMKLIESYRNILEAYTASGQKFEDAILLSNHDMNRIGSTLDGNTAKEKLAASILLTLPGTPYIYYGEEIGMLGKKPDEQIREPFLWSNDSKEIPTWLTPTYNTSSTIIPLDKQKANPSSLFNHYKSWIGYRKQYPALHSDIIDFIPPEFPHVLSYMRGTGKNRLMVIHNLDEKEVEVRVMDPFTILTGKPNRIDEHRLVIGGYESTVLKMIP